MGAKYKFEKLTSRLHYFKVYSISIIWYMFVKMNFYCQVNNKNFIEYYYITAYVYKK